MKQLKQFQKIGVDFMLNRKTALLADDMGLGKTAQAAGVIDRLNPKRALVLTLASLKINWEREIKDFVSKDFKYQILFKTTDKVDPDANIIIVNYDLIIYEDIKKQLRKLDYDVIILDEAHNLSNMEAKRSKNVYSNYGLIRTAQRVYALTGTPVRNRPKDFYIMLKTLAPECIEPYTAYEDYVVHFCAGFRDSYGSLNDKGASNVEELAERIKPFMLRRLKEDVLAELPPLIEKTIELEITPEIQAVLDEENELEGDINEYNPNAELGVQATVRRQLGIAKLPQVYEYIENLLQTEDKIVIFAYHTDVINSIRKQFAGYGVRCVRGGMTAGLKQTEVDLFVKDPNSRIFVGQFTAAGFGVDGLQKVASNVVFAEIDWVPGNMDQARDRVRRMGQTRPVVAHYLVVPNALDDNILQTVIKKGKVITRLLSDTEKTEEKEENDMSIETSLERIATALETMLGVAATAELTCNTCTCGENAPKAEEKPKKAPAKKKSEPKVAATDPVAVPQAAPAPVVEAEIVPDPAPVENSLDDLLGDVAAPAEEVKYTLDDVRTAFQQFIKALGQAEGVAKGKEILTKHGYKVVTEIQEKDFATIIKELKVA